jgi:hypothetical protein
MPEKLTDISWAAGGGVAAAAGGQQGGSGAAAGQRQQRRAGQEFEKAAAGGSSCGHGGYPEWFVLVQAAAILAIWYDRLVTWADKKTIGNKLIQRGRYAWKRAILFA